MGPAPGGEPRQVIRRIEHALTPARRHPGAPSPSDPTPSELPAPAAPGKLTGGGGSSGTSPTRRVPSTAGRTRTPVIDQAPSGANRPSSRRPSGWSISTMARRPRSARQPRRRRELTTISGSTHAGQLARQLRHDRSRLAGQDGAQILEPQVGAIPRRSVNVLPGGSHRCRRRPPDLSRTTRHEISHAQSPSPNTPFLIVTASACARTRLTVPRFPYDRARPA